MEQFDEKELSPSDKLRVLNDIEISRLAGRLKVEPSIEALKAYLEEEQSLVQTFLETNEGFLEETDSALDQLVSQYGVSREDRAPVKVAGRLGMFLEIKGRQSNAFRIFESHPSGAFIEDADIAYILLDKQNVQRPRFEFENSFLHEGCHGAGKKDPQTGKRGLGGGALEEGIVEKLSRTYTTTLNEDVDPTTLTESFQNSPYEPNVQFFNDLAKQGIPEHLFYRAHFQGETETLKDEIENIYGVGAYDYFVKNQGLIVSEDARTLAQHWRECNAYMSVRAGSGHIQSSEDLNREILDPILKNYFVRLLREDFSLFNVSEYGQLWSEEGKAQAREVLSSKYPDSIVEIFFTHEQSSFEVLLSENRQEIEQFIDEKIQGLYSA